MVVKPSPETPLSVLVLAELAARAGFPKGAFSVLTTSLANTPPLSEALCRHPLIKKVTFTGSVSYVCQKMAFELTSSRLESENL
jgi:succinate-semialdehyde dehydrogenase/glutarate-semialdehyde dehydrogenase